MDISALTLGFLGCGKISSAVARGYAIGTGSSRPLKIYVSPRTASKAEALRDSFPDLVIIAATNEEVVAKSDVVYIGLLPNVASEILGQMPFRDDQVIISMMAAVDYDTLLQQTGTVMAKTVRTVPLPGAAVRVGPLLSFPPNEEAAKILSIVGTVVQCANEEEMKPLVSVTGHISHFFEIMQCVQSWAVDNGVDGDAARQFISAFYSSMAQNGARSTESFGDMAEEAATPGGLNAQSVAMLKGTTHFDSLNQSLTEVLDRLKGK